MKFYTAKCAVLKLTMNALFSWAVWKRPWPNLDVVSMNLSSMVSLDLRDVCTSIDWGAGGGHKDVHTQYTSCNNAFNCESKCCYFFTYPANCL